LSPCKCEYLHEQAGGLLQRHVELGTGGEVHSVVLVVQLLQTALHEHIVGAVGQLGAGSIVCDRGSWVGLAN
jgi:hypothetical protein